MSWGDMRTTKGCPKYLGTCWNTKLLSESIMKKRGFLVKGYKSPGYRLQKKITEGLKLNSFDTFFPATFRLLYQCNSLYWEDFLLGWSTGSFLLLITTPPMSYPTETDKTFSKFETWKVKKNPNKPILNLPSSWCLDWEKQPSAENSSTEITKSPLKA